MTSLANPWIAVTRLRCSLIALCLGFGCTTGTSDPASPTTEVTTKSENAEPPHTKCEDDSNCRLSCLEPGDCCGEPPFCESARHWDDHAKVEATRVNCAGFDYTTCPQHDYTVPAEVAIPTCRRGRCMVDKVKREDPPPPIDVSDYERTCASAADCIVVHTQPCAKCGCGQHSIAATEQARFRAAIEAVECPPYDLWPGIDCGDCISPTPVCDGGQCTMTRQRP